MDNNLFAKWDPQIFSLPNETVERIRETTRLTIDLAERYREIVRPLVEVLASYKPKIVELSRTMVEAFRPILAVHKLADVQFVFWEYMTSDFIDEIMNSEDVNKTLREIIVRDKLKKVNETIEKTYTAKVMRKHRRLYIQSVETFRLGHCDLAVLGFTSVLDGLLTDISKQATHKLGPRVEAIMAKLENEEILDCDEYAMLALSITFEKTMYSFTAHSDFSEAEPKELNRHWIVHGRSRRKKTKLDCVKMINLIYGTLLVDEIENKIIMAKSKQTNALIQKV